MASFSDDIVREILVRLEDAADLFRCAVTCKRWRGLVVKASFLRCRCWPEHTSMFLSRLFFWEVKIKKDDTFPTSFIPTPQPIFGPRRRSFKSFFSGAPRAAKSMLRHMEPLASRHGLLLVRLDSPDARGDTVRLAVCNLLVGACHKLPPLKCNWKFDKSGYGLLTGVDCNSNAKRQPSAPQGYSAFFKVLIIGNDIKDQPCNLYDFTSGETRWREPRKISLAAKGVTGYEPLRNARAVVWRGTAHWLLRYFTGHKKLSWHTIDVDTETCRVSLTKIETPIGHDKIHSYDEAKLIIDADGKLSLLHMNVHGLHIDMWTRQEDGRLPRWLCAPAIELNPRIRKSLLMLGEKGGVLLVRDNHGDVYTVDLETGQREKVIGFGGISRRTIVPFEMDWPTFFLTRLGR